MISTVQVDEKKKKNCDEYIIVLCDGDIHCPDGREKLTVMSILQYCVTVISIVQVDEKN